MPKNYVKLTRSQKEVCTAYGLNWQDYLLVGTIGDTYIKVISKTTGKMKTLDKYYKGGKRKWRKTESTSTQTN